MVYVVPNAKSLRLSLPRAIPIRPYQAMKNFEFFIQWGLTERCNLRCRHCYQGGEQVPEMTPDEFKRQIDGATKMFQAWESEHGIKVSPSIHFTGGEPLLYEGFFDVVAYSRGKGYSVALMTNGALITKDDAKRVYDLGISDTQISLEGPLKLHDSIRGHGSYKAMVKGVERLIEAGNRVSGMATLSRLNFDAIEETVEIGKATGLYGIGFSRLVPHGNGKALVDKLLTPQELRVAYQKIFSLNSSSFEVTSGDPLATMFLGVKPPKGCKLSLSGCSAAFSGVTITSDGKVMACRRIGLVAGNLKKKSLREIWDSSCLLWRLRERKSYTGKCGRCSLWPSCRGCRAVAYAYSLGQGKPDLFADDPQCWLSK
jgi:radical SAM protein with 4Fe4S-binding SPASM domain